ncbi:MAG: class I SAM-dependent methyltransferase, partial [Aldersonia sp.]|nr:class I SAM-dependent methyltransferase [Aldersonia sp.]
MRRVAGRHRAARDVLEILAATRCLSIYRGQIRAIVSRIAFDQISRPHGWVAPITARFLNRINGSHNETAVERLCSDDTVCVDLGFGGGAGLAALLRHPRRVVVGIDPSVEMVQRSRRRFGGAVNAGRLILIQGTAEHLPLATHSVDAVVTVHSIYYWSDWLAGMREVARVVRPNGTCLVGVGPNANAHAKQLGLDRVGFRAPTVRDITAGL